MKQPKTDSLNKKLPEQEILVSKVNGATSAHFMANVIPCFTVFFFLFFFYIYIYLITNTLTIL